MLSFGSMGQRPPAGARLLVLFVVAALTIAACGSAAGPAGVPGGGRDAEPQNGVAPQPAGEQGAGNGDGGTGGDAKSALYDLGRPDLLIIKTGSLTIQVGGLEAAIDGATRTVVGLGGYASASVRKGDGEDAYASVTYRVPADRWDEALTTIRGLADKVLDEQSDTQDVTAEVVDLGARIKNLQATELAFQQIMTRATEIKDILAVQAELTKVRGEIESLTAQKARLEEQAAFSTLAVTFALKPNPILESSAKFDPATEVDEATASLVAVLQAVATAGIWFAIVWLPILAVLGIALLIGLFVVRRIRRTSTTAIVTGGGA